METKDATYKVVTPQRTVYVHNVVRVELTDTADIERGVVLPDDSRHKVLTFYRRGGNIARFLAASVVSYEEVA